MVYNLFRNFIVVVEAASPLITMDFDLQHTANLIGFGYSSRWLSCVSFSTIDDSH